MTMRPDPTFHASPKLAMEAPPENFAYTLLLSPDFSKPDALYRSRSHERFLAAFVAYIAERTTRGRRRRGYIGVYCGRSFSEFASFLNANVRIGLRSDAPLQPGGSRCGSQTLSLQ